jgi:hypothetical protein
MADLDVLAGDPAMTQAGSTRPSSGGAASAASRSPRTASGTTSATPVSTTEAPRATSWSSTAGPHPDAPPLRRQRPRHPGTPPRRPHHGRHALTTPRTRRYHTVPRQQARPITNHHRPAPIAVAAATTGNRERTGPPPRRAPIISPDERGTALRQVGADAPVLGGLCCRTVSSSRHVRTFVTSAAAWHRVRG